MSSFWKGLEDGLECWGGGSEGAHVRLDHSWDWKESWRLDGGYDLCTHTPIPARLVNVFKTPSPASSSCRQFMCQLGRSCWALWENVWPPLPSFCQLFFLLL